MNMPVWIENRVADVRFALRVIWKTPGISAVAILSLARGIDAQAPATIVMGSAVLVAAAVLACLIPAPRATHVDPLSALRCE